MQQRQLCHAVTVSSSHRYMGGQSTPRAFRNMLKRPDPLSRGPDTQFPAGASPHRGPPLEPQKTSRGHLSTKMPQWSPEIAPIGQSSSRAFRNMFKRPAPPSRGPKTQFPAGASARDQNTIRGHLSLKMPQSSLKNAPMGQSWPQALRNMFGRPNLPISCPQMPLTVTLRPRAKQQRSRSLPKV